MKLENISENLFVPQGIHISTVPDLLLTMNPVVPNATDPNPRQLHTDLRLTFAPLSLDAVYALADRPSNGAVVVMSGTVREQTEGRPVACLEYQAYEPMALKVFAQIAAQIQQQWPHTNTVVIHHRTGRLNIGEISVLVAIGCPHRAEAFAACRYAIDTLKHQAPIWKKEHWCDGASSWVSIAVCEQSPEAPC